MATLQTPYQQINSLEDDVFIAGTTKTLVFTVYDTTTGALLDLAGSTITWVLGYYAQPDLYLLVKSGTVTGSGEFTISLTPSDTQGLSGKFIHQPQIIDSTGDEFRPAQGIITIIPAIPDA